MEENRIKKAKKESNGFKIQTFFSLRFLFLLVILILQIMVVTIIYKFFSESLVSFWGGGAVVSVFMLLYLIHKPMDSNSKISWMALIIISPIFGSLFYWFVSMDFGHRVMKNRVNDLIEKSRGLIKAGEKDSNNNLITYLNLSNDVRSYKNNRVKYYSLGEYKWEAMLKELKKAEKFIFLEYFIIERSEMWNSILEILKEKAENGVDVRVMYDGTCELATLPIHYWKKLEELGIKAKPFAPLKPFVSTHYNYRDHRKVLVIDGKVAFNGGINLADEYINKKVVHGHWKDTAISIEGPAVNKYTLMFLQMWNLSHKTSEVNLDKEFKPFLNIKTEKFDDPGYLIPYADNPLDNYRAGERVYVEILNTAKKYVHITTPYLILDDELILALKFTAEKGVDVKIIIPGIPDKKTPYALAKNHYKTLLESGVKIYEYTPGYIHAKSFVSDDKVAVVGTINLDYRSLYHHFECATYMNSVPVIKEIEEDFQNTLKVSKRVTNETMKKEPLYMKILGYIAKVLAPLM